MQLCANQTGRRLKGDLCRSRGNFVRESRKAARTVAAHLRFAAVAIVITHPKIRAIGAVLEQKDAVRAHTAMTIADPHDLLRLQADLTRTIVDHHEIVSG